MFDQEAEGLPIRRAPFCRESLSLSDVDVYRKSTGVVELGESAGKGLLRRALAQLPGGKANES